MDRPSNHNPFVRVTAGRAANSPAESTAATRPHLKGGSNPVWHDDLYLVSLRRLCPLLRLAPPNVAISPVGRPYQISEQERHGRDDGTVVIELLNSHGRQGSSRRQDHASGRFVGGKRAGAAQLAAIARHCTLPFGPSLLCRPLQEGRLTHVCRLYAWGESQAQFSI